VKKIKLRKVAFRWLNLVNVLMMHGSTNIKFTKIYLMGFSLHFCYLFLLTYRRPSHLLLGLPAYSMQSRKRYFNLPAKTGPPCSTCSFRQNFLVRVAFGKIRNKHSLSFGTSGTE
jgi:hypothetical protein